MDFQGIALKRPGILQQNCHLCPCTQVLPMSLHRAVRGKESPNFQPCHTAVGVLTPFFLDPRPSTLDPFPMLELEQAVEKILTSIPAPKTEIVPLTEAYGRIAAQQIAVTTDLPPFD